MYNPSIAIVGAGRVGTALASVLSDRGCLIVGVSSRSLASAKRVATLYAATASDKAQEVTAAAEVIFITTPDDFIAEVAGELAKAGGFKKGQFVYHTSGALGAEVLLSAKECGAFVGCIHPLQTLAGSQADKELLRNCYFALDGDIKAITVAKKLVELIGGISLSIPSEGRALYHAAACMVSNYLVTLLHAAGQMLKAVGLTEDESIKVVLPLVQGTLSNIAQQGTVVSLTGPISRGDTNTVVKHFDVLAGTKESDLYAALAEYTTSIAVEKGTLSSKQAKEILKLAKIK